MQEHVELVLLQHRITLAAHEDAWLRASIPKSTTKEDTSLHIPCQHYMWKFDCIDGTGAQKTEGCLAADLDTDTGGCQAAHLDTGIHSCAIVANVECALYGGFRFPSRLLQVAAPHGGGGGLSLLAAGLLWGGQH